MDHLCVFFFFDCIFYAMYEWLCALLTIFSSCVRGFRFFFFFSRLCRGVSGEKEHRPATRVKDAVEDRNTRLVLRPIFFFFFFGLSDSARTGTSSGARRACFRGKMKNCSSKKKKKSVYNIYVCLCVYVSRLSYTIYKRRKKEKKTCGESIP